MSTTETQKRVAKVLERITAACAANADDAEMFSDMLENGLNDLCGYDAFGTEGQTDPRGDMRSGDWSMGHVQGIDE